MRHFIKQLARIVQVARFHIPSKHNVTGNRVQLRAGPEEGFGSGNGAAFGVHAGQAVVDEGVGEEAGLEDKGVELLALDEGRKGSAGF